MQIVIEIDSELFDAIHDGYIESNDHFYVMDAVKNGTPLPEHHGRLVDIDNVEVVKTLDPKHEYTKGFNAGVDHVINAIYNAPTIIPATKEEKHCKACKYSDRGMINVESERCKACYYDGRLGGNCLFEPATKEGDGE